MQQDVFQKSMVTNNTKVMGSIPRECINCSNVHLLYNVSVFQMCTCKCN